MLLYLSISCVTKVLIFNYLGAVLIQKRQTFYDSLFE